MNELFADYIPPAWFDEKGLRRSRPLLGLSATAVKRMRRWKNSAKNLSLSVAVSAAVIAASVSFSQPAASNELDVPLPPDILRVAPPPPDGAPVGDVNKSFDELFAAFRSGTKLITNNRTRQLATSAARRRHIKPEDWARKLASDVKDADD